MMVDDVVKSFLLGVILSMFVIAMFLFVFVTFYD